MSVKNKATGTPQRMYCIHAHDIAMRIFVRSGIRLPHTYIYVGLSALLVSTDRAMRRPTNRGTSNSLAPRLFVYIRQLLLISLFRSW